jgi:tetratricopeptide (TPR) repeat protein
MSQTMRVLAGICLMATFLLGQDPSKLTPEARSFIEVHFLAARQAEADSDFAKAIDEYGQIVKKYPKLVPPVYQNLGLVYYVTRKYEAAIETLSEAVRLDPSMVGARLFLGTAYLDTEQPDKALPHLEYAHKQKPTTESATTLGLAELSNMTKQRGTSSLAWRGRSKRTINFISSPTAI